MGKFAKTVLIFFLFPVTSTLAGTTCRRQNLLGPDSYDLIANARGVPSDAEYASHFLPANEHHWRYELPFEDSNPNSSNRIDCEFVEKDKTGGYEIYNEKSGSVIRAKTGLYKKNLIYVEDAKELYKVRLSEDENIVGIFTISNGNRIVVTRDSKINLVNSPRVDFANQIKIYVMKENGFEEYLRDVPGENSDVPSPVYFYRKGDKFYVDVRRYVSDRENPVIKTDNLLSLEFGPK